MKTTLPKVEEIDRKWLLIDAEGKVLGRLAVHISNILRGRHKPTYTPHIDTGDFVVVINADKVKLTGNKEEDKVYQTYSGWRSGLKEFSAATIREKKPDMLIYEAVKGMMPKNRLSRQSIKKLKIYAGSEHPHEAQGPEAYEVKV
jgi:large subunit ribosomal protein L13